MRWYSGKERQLLLRVCILNTLKRIYNLINLWRDYPKLLFIVVSRFVWLISPSAHVSNLKLKSAHSPWRHDLSMVHRTVPISSASNAATNWLVLSHTIPHSRTFLPAPPPTAFPCPNPISLIRLMSLVYHDAISVLSGRCYNRQWVTTRKRMSAKEKNKREKTNLFRLNFLFHAKMKIFF